MREMNSGELDEVSGGIKGGTIVVSSGSTNNAPSVSGCTKAATHSWMQIGVSNSQRHWKCRNCQRETYTSLVTIV